MKDSSILNAIKQNFTLLIIGAILFLLSLIAVKYYSQISPHDNTIYPEADNGIFDFSEVDFKTQNYTLLHGNVEFYWKQFLTPKDFNNKNSLPELNYLTLPTSWNNLVVNNKKVGANGYGTFRFQIIVPKPGLYGIKIKEFESAFQIWIDSTYYKGAGKVGSVKNEMLPNWQRKEYHFYTHDDTIEVLLQVSNFHHRKGGASEVILFGSSESIGKIKTLQTSMDSFIIGILTILILYLITLYHYHREDKSILYFGLTSIFILLRVCTTGEKLLLELMPFIPWSIAIRIEYIALLLIAPSFTLFYHYLLPGNVPKWFRQFIITIPLMLCAGVLFLPAKLFTYSTFAVIILSYTTVIGIAIFITIALIQRKKNAIGLAIGSLFLFVIIINDLLFYTNSIQSTYLLPFGLIILLFTQTFIISRNISQAYIRVKDLSKQLEKHAEEMEEIVLLRTRMLQRQKNEIEQQKNKIEVQATVLSQTNKHLKKLDKFQKDTTKMMVHDLKNPLNNIIGFLELPKLEDHYKEIMHASGKEMQNLIQNILDVNKYEQTKLNIKAEKTNLKRLADTGYKQNKYIINRKSINFENRIPVNLNIVVDKELITRVFTNIISNGTKYKNENGVIRVSSELINQNNTDYCKVYIYNKGETIPPDKLNSIFSSYSQLHEQRGEYKYSTGIGLTFCKMAIEAHNGEIGVVSKKDEGVTFWFTLPLKNT